MTGTFEAAFVIRHPESAAIQKIDHKERTHSHVPNDEH